ncbi:MAG: Beta-galactosidase C-terminal domain [Anaerolineae bacterium]|nr:Beta-galactosidase C-terminal domain [Anaerolineae bacterium]
MALRLRLADIYPALEAPPSVEVATRWKGDQPVFCILNHDAQTHDLVLNGAYFDLITGAHKSGVVSLAGREVLILVKE